MDDPATCSPGGTWAAPIDAPVPELAAFQDATPQQEADAIARLHVLPVFSRIDAYYAKKRKRTDPAHWWQLSDYAESVQIARLSDGRAIAVVRGGACRGYDEFTMNLEAVYSLAPNGALIALEPAKPSEARWPVAIGDLDHDGEVDIVTLDGFILSRAGKLSDQVYTRGPIYTCPGDGAAAGNFNDQDH
ncbi:MAG: hypothetical protein U0414_20030 [Polyangiaceae bacterium]